MGSCKEICEECNFSLWSLKLCTGNLTPVLSSAEECAAFCFTRDTQLYTAQELLAWFALNLMR